MNEPLTNLVAELRLFADTTPDGTFYAMTLEQARAVIAALAESQRRVGKLTAWVSEVLPFVEGGAPLKESEMYERWRITTAAAGRAALADDGKGQP